MKRKPLIGKRRIKPKFTTDKPKFAPKFISTPEKSNNEYEEIQISPVKWKIQADNQPDSPEQTVPDKSKPGSQSDSPEINFPDPDTQQSIKFGEINVIEASLQNLKLQSGRSNLT